MAPRIRSQAQLAALRATQVPPSLHDYSIISKTTAAAMAGHSIRSFDRLLASGNGPPFVLVGTAPERICGWQGEGLDRSLTRTQRFLKTDGPPAEGGPFVVLIFRSGKRKKGR